MQYDSWTSVQGVIRDLAGLTHSSVDNVIAALASWFRGDAEDLLLGSGFWGYIVLERGEIGAVV